MSMLVRVPRLTTNDDVVRVTRIVAHAGASVATGDVVAEVASEKALVTVEVEVPGVVRTVYVAEGDMVAVGTPLVEIEVAALETPFAPTRQTPQRETSARPTLGAHRLLCRLGLRQEDVTASGSRLSAADVWAHAANVPSPVAPHAPGSFQPLSPAELAMARAVAWHAGAVVPGYVEAAFDALAWRRYADAFRRRHRLLLDPLLSLVSWRLARLVHERPRLNAVIVSNRRYAYQVVNLGFAVQSASQLYLVVVRDAGAVSAPEFCERLAVLQRRAATDSVTHDDLQGATVAFSSMARWQVSRHIPVLPPWTSVTVAHGAGRRQSVIGATFDHRAHTGSDIAELLEQLRMPPRRTAAERRQR
ncbi:MAG: 2-oxo acid dehydrogenase subunit E2 [Vicinamibacterales bacterium]